MKIFHNRKFMKIFHDREFMKIFHDREFMKKDEREIAGILGRNSAPKIREEEKSKLKREMEVRMENMDILTWSAFPDRLLRQIPYITAWVWAVQAFVVFLFAVLLWQDWMKESKQVVVVLCFVGPILALLLVVDVVRSYGCNMWEMEAACRYDLRRVTAMRMCIVGSADMVVLAVCCCIYRKTQGSIWEFGLFVILPFLLSSSIYLWELDRFTGKCSVYVLAVTGLGLNLVCCPTLYKIYIRMVEDYMEWVPVFTVCTIISACIVMLRLAVGLCRRGLAGEGESRRWSLE